MTEQATAARRVHLTGSLPGKSTREAMTGAIARVGPFLRSLPDGEPGSRSLWVRDQVACLAQLREVELLNPGAAWASYEDVPRLQLAPGATLTAAAVGTCLAAARPFPASYATFTGLRDPAGMPGLEYFQVGMPSHLDLAVIAFAEAGFAPGIYQPCLEATAEQIRLCAAQAPDLVFHLEAPTVTSIVASAEPGEQQKTAAAMAGRLAELASSVPPGTRFMVHLCTGDLNHQALTHLDSALPLVLLANELAYQWPGDRPLLLVHLPLAEAALAPRLDPAFYDPLAQVAPELAGRIAAGFVHEKLTFPQHVQLQRLIEELLGAPAAVAATCGLGRRSSDDEAHRLLDMCSALAPVR